jgi:hypothetical protein
MHSFWPSNWRKAIQHNLHQVQTNRELDIATKVLRYLAPKKPQRNKRTRWKALSTVKAPNFGPHGNVGLFLASSVASADESRTKNEQNRTCRPNVFLQLLFSSFFCRTRFSESKPFWKRGPKFLCGPKLGALTVTDRHVFAHLLSSFSGKKPGE